MLQSNALKVLSTFSSGDLEAVSQPITTMVIGSAEAPVLQAIDLDHATRSRGIHRGDLQQFLLQQVDPFRLSLGTTITRWRQRDEGLDIELNTGERIRCALLVGADGIASGVRTALIGAPRPRYSGQWCARTIINGQPAGAVAQEIHAGRYRLGVVPLARGRSYVFWVQSRHPGGPLPGHHIESSIATLGTLGATLQKHFQRGQRWLQHPLTDLSICWGRGNIGLIGDAAHALTPNLGQGAALGIEDAWTLADLLRQRIPSPIEALKEQRHGRVRNVRTLSYLMGRIAHVEQPVLRSLRNRALAASAPDRSRAALAAWLNRFSPC